MNWHKIIFAVSIIIFINNNINAQVSRTSKLYIELKKADSLMFEQGFNKCNMNAFKKILHKDLVFLHDIDGIQNIEQFYNAVSKNICGNNEYKPIRKLLSETLEVFPLKNGGELYGAIQKGAHKFYIKEPNKDIYVTGYAKFITTWILDNEVWKAKQILSFDHKPVSKSYGTKFDADYAIKLFENDKEIELLLKKHKIPSIAIGLIKNGNIQQIRTFGNKIANQQIDKNSIYKVASLTKPIVALTVLKLVDEGKWNLDESVSKYFIDSDIKDSKFLNALTTRHILSHQSGFPNWRYLSKNKKLTFEFEPGTKWQYSGEGFEYLRKAIEIKLGKPFEKIANEILFKPLKMENTHFYWDNNIEVKNYAVEHDENGKPINYKKHTEINAAANLLTTIEDYTIFLSHIINGGGLSEEKYKDFFNAQSNQKTGIDWSLGMQMLPNLPTKETAYMHTGGDYGTKTIAIILKNSKDGLVLFSNSENGMVLWQKIISEYFGVIGEEIVRRNLE